MNKGELYYLGQPYSHPSPVIINRRYELGLMALVELMNEGHHVFSPIAHNHPVQQLNGPDNAWGEGSFWQEYDLNVLSKCSGLIVLKLVGWQESVGLCTEIKFCRDSGINIYYRDAPDVSAFHQFSSEKFNGTLLESLRHPPSRA